MMRKNSRKEKESNTEFLVRLGVAYEFEIGRWSITPEFNVDFVDDEESTAFGISFGYGFQSKRKSGVQVQS